MLFIAVDNIFSIYITAWKCLCYVIFPPRGFWLEFSLNFVAAYIVREYFAFYA